MRNSNYITLPKLTNTGFLPNSLITTTRIKQDLMPQNISNDCTYLTKSIASSMKLPIPGVDIGVAPVTNNNLYPLDSVHWSYGGSEIPNNCPCVKYLAPP